MERIILNWNPEHDKLLKDHNALKGSKPDKEHEREGKGTRKF